MNSVLLNVDAGELASEPDELYRLPHLVNVACGGHAGDARSMDRVVEVASRAGVRVGAHPSYPDRASFGRTTMPIAPDALAFALEAQCAALASIARARGVAVFSMKPHGALYHDANRDPELARIVVGAAQRALGERVAIVGPPQGALADAAHGWSLAFLREGFADRGVRPDGSLVPRGEPGALVTDPARASARAAELARSGDIDTICVHGDTPGALAVLASVRAALDALLGSDR